MKYYETSELASGWDFSGIFYFGLVRKIPESRDRDRDLKVPKKFRKKNPENPGDRDRDFKTSKKSRVQNPENSEIPGFFSLGSFILGIRGLSKFRDFCKIPGDFSEFFTFGISIFFISGIAIFFVGWDIPTKSHL